MHPQLQMLVRRRTPLLFLAAFALTLYLVTPRTLPSTLDVASLRTSICPADSPGRPQCPVSLPSTTTETVTVVVTATPTAKSKDEKGEGNSLLVQARKNMTAVPKNATVTIGLGAFDDDDEPEDDEQILIMPQFPSIMVGDYLEHAEDVPGYELPGGVATLKEKSKVAIVTFLDKDMEEAAEDYYFINARMLTWQILYEGKTGVRAQRRKHVYWIIAVGKLVSEAKREQLRQDGAQVIEIEDLPNLHALNTGDARWAHVMNKLRLFEWTMFSRILFLDADNVLLGPVDDLFYTPESIHPRLTVYNRHMPGEASLPDSYVFIARPDVAYMGGNKHSYPDDPMMTTEYFNAGFWLAAPNKKLFEYLMSLLDIPEEVRPFTVQMPEQNLLNYAFRHCDFFQDQELRCKIGAPLGPMPWVKAEAIWSTNRPGLTDYSFNVRSLHYKGWEMPEGYPLRTLWEETRARMERGLGRWDDKLQKAVKVEEEKKKKKKKTETEDNKKKGEKEDEEKTSKGKEQKTLEEKKEERTDGGNSTVTASEPSQLDEKAVPANGMFTNTTAKAVVQPAE